jgi:hypothetical protein
MRLKELPEKMAKVQVRSKDDIAAVLHTWTCAMNDPPEMTPSQEEDVDKRAHVVEKSLNDLYTWVSGRIDTVTACMAVEKMAHIFNEGMMPNDLEDWNNVCLKTYESAEYDHEFQSRDSSHKSDTRASAGTGNRHGESHNSVFSTIRSMDGSHRQGK